MEIVTETVQQYLDQGYRLTLDCLKCGTLPELTLRTLVEMGFGPRPLPSFRPKCPRCGERLQKVVQAPEKPGLLKDGRPPSRHVPT